MRVGVIQNYNTKRNLQFGNLTKEEKEGFIQTKNAALDVLGHPNKSVFIYSSACLPQTAETNTGTGTLVSKQGEEFLDVVRTFTTANVVQDLPSGEFMPSPARGFYSPYNGSGMALSSHLIEPELLMDESMGKLINADDLAKVVAANDVPNKTTMATFENIVEPESEFETMLRKAHETFKSGQGEKMDALRAEFTQYKAANADWLESHAIFDSLSRKYETPIFKNWPDEIDRNLYDLSLGADEKAARKTAILTEHADEIEFYNFKQFLAERSLAAAKAKANAQGMKFGGDVVYNFSMADIFSNPKAFVYDVYMGPNKFEYPALDFYRIGEQDNPAAKILAQKFRLAAQRYDTLRLDTGWGYITPIMRNSDGSYFEHKELGSQVVDMIENVVKGVKGDKFDKHDLFWEVEADIKDFRAFQDDGQLIAPLKDRTKIYTSSYMSDTWGSSRVFGERFGSPTEFLYGASAQDSTPLVRLAAEEAYAQRKAPQVKELANIFQVEPATLEAPEAFIRAKNAEPLFAKSNFMFFTDFFRLPSLFDKGAEGGIEDFRSKVPAHPEQAYYDAVKKGRAFNLMDALERVFVAKGFDKEHPELFANIQKFKNKLYGTEGAKIPENVVDTAFTGGEVPTVVPTAEVPPAAGAEAGSVANPVANPAPAAGEAVESPKVTVVGDTPDVKPGTVAGAAEEAVEGARAQGEEVVKAAKKNKYLKPALIIAGVLVAACAAFKYLKKEPKAA